MNIQPMFTTLLSKILVSIIEQETLFISIVCLFSGDQKAIERAKQTKPFNEEPNEKMSQASVRRQRRLDGLQLFEKTKLNR